MTIIEALKSGKRFKRLNDLVWLTYKNGAIYYYDGTVGCDDFALNAKKILADDWVIEEPEVKVTRSQIAKAWDRCFEKEWDSWTSERVELFENFCKDLGLEE